MHLQIVPFLCFNNQAEEAVEFYVSIFCNSRILRISRYGERELQALARLPEEIRPGPAGSVKIINFSLERQELLAANGGPFFSFNHGISLYVKCDTQAEIDNLWSKLSDGGEIEECGWLKDKFGVSWQIAPTKLDEWLSDPDQHKAQRVAIAVFSSKKLDIENLKKAYEG